MHASTSKPYALPTNLKPQISKLCFGSARLPHMSFRIVEPCLWCASVWESRNLQPGLNQFVLELRSQGFLCGCEDAAAGDGGKHDSWRRLAQLRIGGYKGLG